jgi:hypothetical protein
VYLGSLSNPVTEEEVQVLSQWDAIILDHNKDGVLEAVGDESIPIGPHIIARLDLAQMISSVVMNNELDMSRIVYVVSWTIQQTLLQPDKSRYFTAVLIAGWRERISPPLFKGLASLFSAHGLEVYLEVAGPDFLDGEEQLDINMFAGMVVRNGTVRENGERRDFFGMDNMKSTTKSFVSQACQRPFVTMMWDTIDDDASLSHAVVRSYHGAIPYLTRQRALTNVLEICSYAEPLAAFQWLKDRRVMEVHEKYRAARIVSSCPLVLWACSNTQ